MPPWATVASLGRVAREDETAARRIRRHVWILVIAAVAIFASDGSVAQAAQQCYVNSSGELEVNVGSQFGYTDEAIRAAIDTAKAGRCQVYFAPGMYSYNSPLVNDGLRFYGQCSADAPAGLSLLVASNPDGSAIFLRGDGPEVVCLRITSPNASLRSSSNNANGITIDFATNFLVDHTTVDKTAAAGIFNRGGGYGRITSNHVVNSLADGIHNTRGAHHTHVASNTVSNTGDDFIAVVSYAWQGVRTNNITIRDNVLSMQTHGRGIVVSGGYTISIVDNILQHCRASCIHVASEPESSWNTYDVDDVEVAMNVVRFPDEGLVHHANVLLWCGSPGRHVNNVYGGDNNFDRSREMIRTVAENGCTFSGVTVSGAYGE